MPLDVRLIGPAPAREGELSLQSSSSIRPYKIIVEDRSATEQDVLKAVGGLVMYLAHPDIPSPRPPRSAPNKIRRKAMSKIGFCSSPPPEAPARRIARSPRINAETPRTRRENPHALRFPRLRPPRRSRRKSHREFRRRRVRPRLRPTRSDSRRSGPKKRAQSRPFGDLGLQRQPQRLPDHN